MQITIDRYYAQYFEAHEVKEDHLIIIGDFRTWEETFRTIENYWSGLRNNDKLSIIINDYTDENGNRIFRT